MMGKRFFKLRYVRDVTATVIRPTAPASWTAYVKEYIQDDPVTDPAMVDWTSLSQLFDMYRICAMKLKFIPAGNFAPVMNAVGYSPMYVWHDPNTPNDPFPDKAGLLDVNDILAHENCKIKNMFKPWSYYRKMQRNIPPASLGEAVNLKGYLPTRNAANAATQITCFQWQATMQQSTTDSWPATDSQVIGTLMITKYMVLKGRQ